MESTESTVRESKDCKRSVSDVGFFAAGFFLTPVWPHTGKICSSQTSSLDQRELDGVSESVFRIL